MRLVARRRLLLEPDRELQHGERPAVAAPRRNGYDGLDTEFVYNKTSWSAGRAHEEVDLRRHHADRRPGPQPRAALHLRQMLDLLRLDGGARQHRAPPRRSTGAPPTCRYEEGTTPRNSTIGGATLWVMKGHKAEEYDGGRRLPRLRRQPRPAGLVAQGDGLRADHQQGLRAAKAEGYYTEQPDARDRHPAAQSRHADGQLAGLPLRQLHPDRPSRCARSWRRCSPTRRRRSRRSTTRCAAATRSCASSRSCNAGKY